MLINIGVTIDQVDKDVGNEIQCPTQHLWGESGPLDTCASTSSVANDSEPELQTWIAPNDLSSSSCSGLRTILTSGIPSSWQSFTSIWPRFDAAAVCTRPE